MDNRKMKILLIGAGVIGTAYGVNLVAVEFFSPRNYFLFVALLPRVRN